MKDGVRLTRVVMIAHAVDDNVIWEWIMDGCEHRLFALKQTEKTTLIVELINCLSIE